MDSYLVSIIALMVIIISGVYHYLFNFKKKSLISYGINHIYRPATKYKELLFYHNKGKVMVESHMFFTQRNNCPIFFESSDGKGIMADIHFNVTTSEEQVHTPKGIAHIEKYARKNIIEELKKLCHGMTAETITKNDRLMIEKLRPVFEERMNRVVIRIDHLMLIGHMSILEDHLVQD